MALQFQTVGQEVKCGAVDGLARNRKAWKRLCTGHRPQIRVTGGPVRGCSESCLSPFSPCPAAPAAQSRDLGKDCIDQPELANCALILQAQLCGNEYYSSFSVPAAPASSQMPSLCGSRDEGWLWRQVWIVCWGEGMVRHGLQRESSFRSCPSQKSRVEPQQLPVPASLVVLSRVCLI